MNKNGSIDGWITAVPLEADISSPFLAIIVTVSIKSTNEGYHNEFLHITS